MKLLSIALIFLFSISVFNICHAYELSKEAREKIEKTIISHHLTLKENRRKNTIIGIIFIPSIKILSVNNNFLTVDAKFPYWLIRNGKATSENYKYGQQKFKISVRPNAKGGNTIINITELSPWKITEEDKKMILEKEMEYKEKKRKEVFLSPRITKKILESNFKYEPTQKDYIDSINESNLSEEEKTRRINAIKRQNSSITKNSSVDIIDLYDGVFRIMSKGDTIYRKSQGEDEGFFTKLTKLFIDKGGVEKTMRAMIKTDEEKLARCERMLKRNIDPIVEEITDSVLCEIRNKKEWCERKLNRKIDTKKVFIIDGYHCETRPIPQ